MKILKFGGSSVEKGENIKRVIKIVSRALRRDKNIVVVVSAVGGITDKLLELASLASAKDKRHKKILGDVKKIHDSLVKELISVPRRKMVLGEVKNLYNELENSLGKLSLSGEFSLKAQDEIVSFGERLSAYIVYEGLKERKISVSLIDSRELIKTDNSYGSANVDIKKSYGLIYASLRPRRRGVLVAGGFIASTHDGAATTLGRGGSDYTASLFGAAANADLIEIWTDVDGVLTADPRKVSTPLPVPKISYEEVSELAYFGAKVIHPKTMNPARLRNIPIDIKNTFNPGHPGTRISRENMPDFRIKGITSLDAAILRIEPEYGAEIRTSDMIRAFYDSNIEILILTQASHDQSLLVGVSRKDAHRARDLAEKFLAPLPISFENEKTIVAVVKSRGENVAPVVYRSCKVLSKEKVRIETVVRGSSGRSLLLVTDKKDEKRALSLLHEEFFNKNSRVNIFLLGTGLIGSTLLKQIKSSGAPISVAGLANSKQMVLGLSPISLSNWKSKLARGEKTDIKEFIDRMRESTLSNKVFVDCTASAAAAEAYSGILEAGIPIVTPNKIANSGTYDSFRDLRRLSEEKGLPFIYETNVGAGLPIIHTIKNLVSSGDQIREIEAVLSGTLSFIFNTFSESSRTFSDIVLEAKRKGYTEPDPREDLCGRDVARKILILGRVSGLELEAKEVKVKPILSGRCLLPGSLEVFFKELKKENDKFEKLRQGAQKKGKVLRYVATLKNGKAEVGLKEIGKGHPFYILSGSDNIISIKTKRYSATPLVIKGPGAGAEVSAGGVLANIISILK